MSEMTAEDVAATIAAALATATATIAEDHDHTFVGYCPVCCSTVDVDGTGMQALECNNCETTFVIVVDPDKVASASL